MRRWWQRVFIALFLAGAGIGMGEWIYSWQTGIWQRFDLRYGGLPFTLLLFSAFSWLPYASRPSASTHTLMSRPCATRRWRATSSMPRSPSLSLNQAR
jgi:hypothetical protein